MPPQLYAIGWHLVSQTRMSVSGAPNSTGRESISLCGHLSEDISTPFCIARMGKKEKKKIYGNQYVKFQPHGTLIFFFFLDFFFPLGISYISHMAQLIIQPFVLGLGMPSILEQTANMSNMIDRVIICFLFQFKIS